MEGAKKIKHKQIIWGVGFLSSAVFLLAFGMWLNDPHRGQLSEREKYEARKREVSKNYTVDANSLLSAEESWIAYSEQELKMLREENGLLKEKLASIEESLSKLTLEPGQNQAESNPFHHAHQGTLHVPKIENVDATASLDVPLPTLSEENIKLMSLEKEATNYASLMPPQFETGSLYPSAGSHSGVNLDTAATQQENKIEYVSLYNQNQLEKHNTKHINNYLPAGSFATAVLLSGVDAPTGGQAGSNPIPVLLRVKHNGQLPNYISSDVSDCHVLGAAYGDIASERAYIRLEKLTCVLMNGDIVETDFNGYVSGEDGKAGFRGRVVSKNGSMIAKSLLAGVLGGLGESVSKSYTNVATSALGQVQTFNPDKAMQSGLGRGASNALEKLADYYIQRANETYPVIEIDAHRIGEIVVLKGADFGDVKLIGGTHQQGGQQR